MHTQHHTGWCGDLRGCAASEQQPAVTSLQVQQNGTWTPSSAMALGELMRTSMHTVTHQDDGWQQTSCPQGLLLHCMCGWAVGTRAGKLCSSRRWARGGLALEFPSQTSKPSSEAAKAWEPVLPLETHPREVSSTPCMKKATFLAPAQTATAWAALSGLGQLAVAVVMALWPWRLQSSKGLHTNCVSQLWPPQTGHDAALCAVRVQDWPAHTLCCT